MTAWVRSFYLQRRAPVAIILVLTITVASVLGNVPAQLSAGLALLGIILQVLFEIDEKITDTRIHIWYPTFPEALPHVTNEIKKRLHRGQVRIRWIGVTHEAGWPFIQNTLLNFLGDHFSKAASIQIELAVLDPDGDICRRTDGPDHNQIRSTKEKVSRFIATRKEQLITQNSTITLYFYDYRPTWHALLLDEDTLFYSTAMPQNLAFASPQGGVEVVKIDTGKPQAERVHHFIAWFDAIAFEARKANKFVDM